MICSNQMEATFKTAEGTDQVIDFIRAWDYGNEPLKVKVYGAGSTLSYKAVFWIWMRSFSEQFNGRNRPTDKKGQELHDIFCYQFLGMMPERKLKNGKIPERLRTITYPEDLNKGQWFDFMRQIEEQAQKWGLTIPENNSEYENDKRKQNQ